MVTSMADPTLADVMAAIAAQTAVLNDLRSLVRTTLSQELQMANVLDPIAAQVTALTTEVANETTVNASAITLLNGLSGTIAGIAAQLQQALANAADPAQVAAIATSLGALATTVHDNAGALAAAVTANTPTPTP